MSDVELEQEREFLLRSLTDLEAERTAGDIDDDDYRQLKDGYTARAASVLHALDEGTVQAQVNATGKKPRSRTAIALVGMLAFGGAAGLLLAHGAGTRLPGDNITGSTPTSPAVKLDAQAQKLIGTGDVLGAIKLYDKALKLAPQNAEALAYKGWLLRLAGVQGGSPALIDTGLASIRQAEAADPTYPDAHFFAGETLLRDKRDANGAIVEFQQFLADNPPQGMVPEVQGELQQAQAALTSSTTTTP